MAFIQGWLRLHHQRIWQHLEKRHHGLTVLYNLARRDTPELSPPCEAVRVHVIVIAPTADPKNIGKIVAVLNYLGTATYIAITPLSS